MQDSATTPPGSLWRLPAMLLLAGYTVGGFTGFFVTMSSLPAWLAGRGTPDGLAGLVTTVLLAATVVTQLLVPRLTQQFGLAPVLAAGLIALGAPSLLLLIDGGLGWVLGICAVRGIGFGILTVLGSTLTARIVPVSRRGEAVGIYGLAIAVPNLLAVPAGVALVSAGSFTPVAILGAAPLLALVTVPALSRVAGAGRETGPEAGTGIGPTGTDGSTVSVAETADGTPREVNAHAARSAGARQARRAAAIAASGPSAVLLLVTLAGGGFLTYLPIARPDGALATVGLLVWGGTGALARWRVGLLADRSGIRRLLPAASVVTVLGMGIVVTGLLLRAGPEWAVTVIGAAVLGAGYGSVQNLTLIAAFARARQRETATVSSVWNVGFDSGTAIGAALVGALVTVIDVPAALAVTALLVAASIPLAVRSSRPPTG